MSASELLSSTSNTSVKKQKGKDKPEDALETDADVKRQEAKMKRERLVTRLALGVSLPSGLQLQPQDRWEAFLVRAERRLRMQLTLSTIVLFSSILFIASAHFTQPHPLTSTASYKAFLVTAFLSSGSLVHIICTIPRIRVILQRPVFPLLWLSVGIAFNVSASPSMMVTLALISWEQTSSVGLLIFCIVFTVLLTILCILADIFLDTITTSHDV
ncbi:uncharacterized protein HD556DRAFT_1374519 [Suillus plorans]|uniref:Uncharacterized protein n=1 Tax=Suillus plorans TaxID=116603 RepID=A0A9P7DHW7_9AGAM|nr:uncharacterized protein HD556DRAFT_1374519 [Suillus plorans]KAG1793530.1 hypothetical protein HD556DRAFT_1374519 [Suillus plorans]